MSHFWDEHFFGESEDDNLQLNKEKTVPSETEKWSKWKAYYSITSLKNVYTRKLLAFIYSISPELFITLFTSHHFLTVLIFRGILCNYTKRSSGAFQKIWVSLCAGLEDTTSPHCCWDTTTWQKIGHIKTSWQDIGYFKTLFIQNYTQLALKWVFEPNYMRLQTPTLFYSWILFTVAITI